MHPGTEQKVSAFLAIVCARLQQPVEIGRRAFRTVVVVIPAREIQNGSVYAAIFVAQFGPVPPRVLCGMRKPVIVVGGGAAKPVSTRQWLLPPFSRPACFYSRALP